MTTPTSYLRLAVAAMTGYQPGEQPGPGEQVTKLNTNENPYPPSPRVLEAVRGAAGESLRLYPRPLADGARLRAAEVYGFHREQVLVGNGSDELLTLLLRALVEPGQAIAYPVPTYSLYPVLAQIQGADTVVVPFPEDFSLPEELFGRAEPLVLLCNPNAPTGTLVAADEARRLAESLTGVLVVDEAYVDFADGDCLALARELANVVVLRTLSKSFSLAGLRVGFAFGPAELIAGLIKVKDSYNVDRLALAGAEAALVDLDHMRASVEKIRATRSRLIKGLKSLGLAPLPSQSNFVFVRCGEGQAGRLYRELKGRGILVRFFDEPGLSDALRITVGTDQEIDRLLAELADILKSN
jgi:histidinol-phosphate aminotransferase